MRARVDQALDELKGALAACPEDAVETKAKLESALALLESDENDEVNQEGPESPDDNVKPSSVLRLEKQLHQGQEELRKEKKVLHESLSSERKEIRASVELLVVAQQKVLAESHRQDITSEQAMELIIQEGKLNNDASLKFIDLLLGEEQATVQMHHSDQQGQAYSQRQEDIELRFPHLKLALIQELSLTAGMPTQEKHQILALLSSLQAKQQAQIQCSPSFLRGILAAQSIQQDNEALRELNSRLETENRYVKASKMTRLERLSLF